VVGLASTPRTPHLLQVAPWVVHDVQQRLHVRPGYPALVVQAGQLERRVEQRHVGVAVIAHAAELVRGRLLRLLLVLHIALRLALRLRLAPVLLLLLLLRARGGNRAMLQLLWPRPELGQSCPYTARSPAQIVFRA
jgi:hypothetical protein